MDYLMWIMCVADRPLGCRRRAGRNVVMMNDSAGVPDAAAAAGADGRSFVECFLKAERQVTAWPKCR